MRTLNYKAWVVAYAKSFGIEVDVKAMRKLYTSNLGKSRRKAYKPAKDWDITQTLYK